MVVGQNCEALWLRCFPVTLTVPVESARCYLITPCFDPLLDF